MEEEEFTPSSEGLNVTSFQHQFNQLQDDLPGERNNNKSNEYCQPNKYTEKNYLTSNNEYQLHDKISGKSPFFEQISQPTSNPIDYYKKLQEIMQKDGGQIQQQDERPQGNIFPQRQETVHMRYSFEQIERGNDEDNNKGKQEQLQFYNQKNCGNNLGSNNLFNPQYTDASQSNNNQDNQEGCFNVQKVQKPQGDDNNQNDNDDKTQANKNLQIINTLAITEHEDIGQLQFEEFEFSERVEEPNIDDNKQSLGMKYILPYQIPQVKAFLLNGEIIVSFELFEKSSKTDFNKVSVWNMFRPIAAISNMKNLIEVSMHSSQHTISDFQPIITRLLSLGDQEAYASARMLSQHQLSLQKEESIKSQVFEIYGEKHLQHLQWQLEENFVKSKQLAYALMDKLPEESLFLYSIRRTDPATLDSIFCGLGYSKALIRLLAGSDNNYQQYCMRQGLPEFFDNKSLLQILMMNLLASNKAQMTITTLDDITLPIEMRVHYQKLAQTEILPGVFKEDYMKIYQIVVSQKSLHQIHCLRGFQHGSQNELVATRNSPCELNYSMKSHSFIQRYYPDDRNTSQKIAGQVEIDPEEFSKDFQRIFGNQNEGQNFLNNVYNTTIAPTRKETNKINSNSSSSSVIDREDKGNNDDKKIKNYVQSNNKNIMNRTKKRTLNSKKNNNNNNNNNNIKSNINKLSNPTSSICLDGIVSSESSSNESIYNAIMRNNPRNNLDINHPHYSNMQRDSNSFDRVEEEKIESQQQQNQIRSTTFAAARIETPLIEATVAISPSAAAALAVQPEESLCISDSSKSFQNMQSLDNSSVFYQQVGRQTASPQNNSRECSDILLLH